MFRNEKPVLIKAVQAFCLKSSCIFFWKKSLNFFLVSMVSIIPKEADHVLFVDLYIIQLIMGIAQLNEVYDGISCTNFLDIDLIKENKEP